MPAPNRVHPRILHFRVVLRRASNIRRGAYGFFRHRIAQGGRTKAEPPDSTRSVWRRTRGHLPEQIVVESGAERHVQHQALFHIADTTTEQAALGALATRARRLELRKRRNRGAQHRGNQPHDKNGPAHQASPHSRSPDRRASVRDCSAARSCPSSDRRS